MLIDAPLVHAQGVRRCLALCVALALWAIPSSAEPQSDTTRVVGATLRDWDERLRVTIYDRSGSFFGRLSDRGILQRFNEQADSEYQLDLIAYGFSLIENYNFYRHDTRARFWGGSISKLRVVGEAQVAASVALGDSWSIGLRLDHQTTLQTQRSLVRVGVRHQLFAGRASVFLESLLQQIKPEMDLELGFALSPGAGKLTVAVALLDAFSDLIYQGLGVHPSISDTVLDYTSHPVTLRIALDAPLGPLRIEGYALGLSPTSLVVSRQSDLEDGFTQDERFAYAGGLIEWASPSSARTAVGGFGTWVRAQLRRGALAAGRPEDNFDLTETTWRLGLYAIHRFDAKFETEAWMGRIWRLEDRFRPDTVVAPHVDYEDRTWAGRGTFTYRARSGFRSNVGLAFTARDVSGAGMVPSRTPLDKNDFRLLLELGWEFGRKAFFVVGVGVELDDDIGTASEGSFDGAHARLALTW